MIKLTKLTNFNSSKTLQKRELGQLRQLGQHFLRSAMSGSPDVLERLEDFKSFVFRHRQIETSATVRRLSRIQRCTNIQIPQYRRIRGCCWRGSETFGRDCSWSGGDRTTKPFTPFAPFLTRSVSHDNPIAGIQESERNSRPLACAPG